MKEQTLVEMRNKIDTLGQVVQKMYMEMQNLSDLSIGTHELVKRFDGYDTAIEKLKEEMAKAEEPKDGLIE
jgi:hypothetical protein